jgi:hypothetical protein
VDLTLRRNGEGLRYAIYIIDNQNNNNRSVLEQVASEELNSICIPPEDGP